MHHYKWLVVGAGGQVGRAIARYLNRERPSDVALLSRTPILNAPVDVYVGDPNDMKWIPEAANIINAAGLTKLNGKFDDYFQSNVLLPMRLLRHAERTGAVLHHISSIAVASPNEYAYRMSKKMSERLLAGMVIGMDIEPLQLRIYRIGDVVPDPDEIEDQFRPDHWLPMLYRYNGFRDFRPEYEVFLACGSDIASAMYALKSRHGVHNVCGLRYRMDYLSSFVKAPYNPVGSKVVQRLMRPTPSLASLIDEVPTNAMLEYSEHKWTPLDDNYWRKFAELSAPKGSR